MGPICNLKLLIIEIWTFNQGTVSELKLKFYIDIDIGMC